MKQKGIEKNTIMEIIGGVYIVYYLRNTYVVSIEKWRYLVLATSPVESPRSTVTLSPPTVVR